MPNPRANRPLTLDRVVDDLKSFSVPAQGLFDMMAGALRGSAVGTAGLPGDLETLGRMGLNAAGGSFNPAMPSRSGRAFQPVSEEPYFPSSEELAKRFPPTIPNGDPVRRKSAEPFEELGQFAPLPMSGKALKVLPYALGRGTGMATKEAARAINDAMVYQTGPLSQGPLSMLAPKGAVSHVVKPKGGNWLGGGMKGASAGDVDERLGRLKTPTIAGDTPAQRIPLHEALLKDPTLNQDQIDRVLYQLEAAKGEAAVDQWIANNVGNYIKKDMATPTDPVRLMFERRAQEIEAQFQTDMSRAERTRARAEAETDPRRQANLTRQATQQEEQAKFDRDFATEHITHLPKDEWGDLSNPSEELMQKRQREGFQMLGEAKSDPAQRWENLTDEAVGINRAGDVQAQKDAMIKAQDTERAFLNKDDEINQTFRPRLIEILAQKGEKLLDKDIDALVKITPTSEKATILGERETWSDLRNQAQQARIDVNSGLWDAYNKNKWVDKLDPETNVYSAYIGDLGIDHVVDVIRQDVAAGRIRPEQLNKLSMDQAIQRTAEFNMEQAKKMRDTAIKQTEGMPTHKEYPDEGYKWIELALPEIKEMPSTHQIEPYESKLLGTMYRPVNKETRMHGEGYKTEEQATKEFLREHAKEKLEEALKYEGNTMGHCVGGYCPDVVEGRSRIYSLRDKRGEPHVTVEVQPMRGSELGRYAADLPEGEDVAAMKNPPLRIAQIKGKGNARPVEKYDPYTQDFVKSGKWSEIRDLKNTGLLDFHNMIHPESRKAYEELGLSVPQYGSEKEFDDLYNEYARLVGSRNYNPPEDGMKAGGSVHISDNPDTMMMELGDKRMKGGGAEDDTKPFIGYPKLAKQARYARAVAPERGDVNLLKDPQTYAFVMGMLGEAPDELGFTALDSDEQKQKIKAAGEKGFVTGAATQLGPLAQLGKKAGKKILSLAGEGINERMLSGRSLTPFIDTPAPAMFAVPPGDLKSIQAAGRASHQEQAATRAAIDAEIAEQMAKLPARSRKANEAMGLYHPVGGGIKLSKPTRGMHSTTVADPEFNPPEIGIITPEQLVKEEAALFPLVGDRAAGGRYLTHVGENELEVPVRLTAGARYMDANYNRRNPDESAAWESGLGRVTALGRQAQRAGEGGRPVYGIYTAGSATNTDFNVMGANALIQQIPFGKITKKAEKEFDRAMKVGTQEFPAIPNWPGIRSPEARAMLLDKSNGIVRTKLFGTMGKENFQSMGFPDVPTTRKAIIEPELLDIPTNQAGFRLAKMDTTGRIIENPNIPSDYPAAMAGKVAGKLDEPADYKDIFQSHFDARRLLSQPESGDYYSFSRAHPIQYADEQWLNRLMEQRLANERKIKEGKYKKGGEIIVKPKKDGQKFKPGRKPDQILKHGQAMPRGKDPEVDIGQMAPMMMAGGGEVNADDLILEERPL